MPQHNRQVFIAKKRTHFGQIQPPQPVYNLQPHIGGRHPVLYFTIQVTEKYSAAMYYSGACYLCLGS